ncbi:MAG TPA: LLM class flavin-dependent oxidoreductase [Acidimicrobiia bacterium]|nr:LLM class flavin-dependent oxidoreductase [Acidimicrobiia bacterium]
MTIEICVQTMRGYQDTLTIARWCEVEGVPVLAVADHYLSGPDLGSEGFDQLVLLGGIARETTTLELCTLVSPLTFRHPAVHLKAAVTLDQMSSGRFSLGIGTGWMELEHEAFGFELPPMDERFDRLEESLSYVRAGIDGTGTGFDGTHYRLSPFDPQPRPTRLRLIVGGGGPRRTPELAARFADEFNVFPSRTSPASERIQTFREAALGAGRDPDSVLLSTAFPGAIALDAEGATSLLRQRAERTKTTPEEVASMLDRMKIPHGTPDRAAPGIASLAEAGISRIYLQLSASPPGEIGRAVAAARRAVDLAT